MPAKVNESHRVWLTARLGSGAPATGIASDKFTITVRNPGDTATMTPPSVTEVGGGLYRFDISAAFSLVHGVGVYGVVVEIDATAPSVRDTRGGSVEFFGIDVDDVVAAVWDAPTSDHGTAGSFGRATNSLAEEAAVQAAPAPTSTAFATDLDEADGFWVGMLVLVVETSSGNAVARNIEGYTNTDGLITVAALPFTPTAGDVVLVVRRRGAATPDIVPSNR